MDQPNPNNRKDDNGIRIQEVYGGTNAVYKQEKAPIWFVKSRNILYYILGVIEVLLFLRFIFMLLGANPSSGFTIFLYSVSGIFTAPFSGIFNALSTTGLVSRSVFDPAIIIAMAIYALAIWGIVRLLWIKVSKDGY